MIALAIALKGGFTTTNDSRYYRDVAQLRAMQAEVNRIYEEYKTADETTKAKIDKYGENAKELGNSSSLESLFKVVSSTNVNGDDLGNFDDYKYFDQDFIKKTLDLDGIDKDFIVNLKTRSVICVENIEKSGVVYHSLCQIKGEQYNVKYNNSGN